VAWLLAKKSFIGKSLLDSLVYLPLVLPPVVPGFLLLLLLGSQGVLGKWLQQTFGISVAFTWIGAVIASAVMAFPLMVRSARLAISQVDKRLEAAASITRISNHYFAISLARYFDWISAGV
jgi:molybdate transport system permease protein